MIYQGGIGLFLLLVGMMLMIVNALASADAVIVVPAYGQSNPTLNTETIQIDYIDFNKVARDTIIFDLEHIHPFSWQATIHNDLMYANQDGNAVVRFYDETIPDKFIEVGMGSPPDDKYWIAVQLPDLGYVVIHNKLERGWIPGAESTLAYTDNAGLTVNNGERIVLSNLDVGGFAIKSYSVHGMESSSDPPAVNSGVLIVEFISGDPTQSPLQLFPFILVGSLGVIVVVLLVTKKRSSPT